MFHALRTIIDALFYRLATSPGPSQSPDAGPSNATPATPKVSIKEPNKALVDFFSSIEEEQPNMFNPQTNRYL